MKLLKLVPDHTNVDFMRWRNLAVILSTLLTVASLAFTAYRGLNLGVDFVGGQMVRNLRLSGETIAKIFTNKITNWSDPAITKDNNGRKFPDLAITPVVLGYQAWTYWVFRKRIAVKHIPQERLEAPVG